MASPGLRLWQLSWHLHCKVHKLLLRRQVQWLVPHWLDRHPHFVATGALASVDDMLGPVAMLVVVVVEAVVVDGAGVQVVASARRVGLACGWVATGAVVDINADDDTAGRVAVPAAVVVGAAGAMVLVKGVGIVLVPSPS